MHGWKYYKKYKFAINPEGKVDFKDSSGLWKHL